MDKLIPGTHIYWVEYRCQHCGKLPPDFYVRIDGKEINLKYMFLFSAFEWIRGEYDNKPIPITRGYSCTDQQLFIFLSKVRKKYGGKLDQATILKIAADPTMTPFSEHVFGLALDLKPPSEDLPEVLEIARRARPKLRIGFYPGSHIHIGVGYRISPRYSRKLREGAEW